MKVELRFFRRCPEWHEYSCPYIVDAETGETIASIPQFVGHPGEYDAKALRIAEEIVEAVNGYNNGIVETTQQIKRRFSRYEETKIRVMVPVREATASDPEKGRIGVRDGKSEGYLLIHPLKPGQRVIGEVEMRKGIPMIEVEGW